MLRRSGITARFFFLIGSFFFLKFSFTYHKPSLCLMPLPIVSENHQLFHFIQIRISLKKVKENRKKGDSPSLTIFYSTSILFSSFETTCYFIPVYNIPECINVFWTTILEFQIVSMFPNIKTKNWCIAFSKW